MSLVCKGRLLAVICSLVLWVGCGDVYRPTIIPNPVPTPDPKNFHSAIALNQNTPAYAGTGMQVDVSGDSTLEFIKVAMGPVHAAVQSGGSRVWVANSLSNSVSTFNLATGSVITIVPATDINLPSGFSPVFVGASEPASTTNANVYVASATSPNPTSGNGTVTVLSAATQVVTAQIPVGRNPVAIAETPNFNLPFNRELYVVNQGDNTVTHIHGVDQSVVTPAIAVGPSPSLAAARADNQRIYVLNQGSISTIDTRTDVIVTGAATPVDAGTDFMLYDSQLNRLYVTSSTGFLYVYNAAVDPGSVPPSAPFLMKKIAIPGAGDCAQCVPVSVSALPDGTRIYVASAFETTDTTKCLQPIGGPAVNCYLTQVTVIDAVNLTVNAGTSTAPNPIPVPTATATVLPGVSVLTEAACASTRFRVSMAAAADSSKVFLAACDAGGVASINTSSETYVVTLPSPVSAYPPIQTDPNIPAQPPRQNPVFLISGN